MTVVVDMRLDSTSAEVHASLATFKLFYEFEWAGSEREFRRAIQLNPNYAFAAGGDRASAMATLERLTTLSKGGRVLPFNLALVYLGLGDHGRALDNLERALAADSRMMAWLGRDAIFDPLRAEPRFMALMKKLNFVE